MLIEECKFLREYQPGLLPERNLDGLTEHHIFKVIQQMMLSGVHIEVKNKKKPQ